ncbi:hypothetical protein [Pseudovibrio sp. JE062]|uniref:hypothetical protein n=1 Tax=Pseudovibrio sp. JE062 TaxID=439495 RepID=UPI000186C22D|nr:hypothetical protein [Pseudovibrio sp. JE062]EEA92704.1 hypothetical protein PJE062_4208 [Pseudovibrio sp. JE062]
MNYFQIPSLSDVYLEDSYVLAIHEYDSKIVFDLEVVLIETHPFYEAPSKGEKYCYRKSSLSFIGVQSVEWLDRQFIRFSDASGESDYGNIDSFTKEGELCHLAGDWGEVKIRCASVELVR